MLRYSSADATSRADDASRKKPKVDFMRKFLEPSFSMFETKEVTLSVDEYGASIDDLQFRDIQSSDVKWYASVQILLNAIILMSLCYARAG
jgi:hypothetical protein